MGNQLEYYVTRRENFLFVLLATVKLGSTENRRLGVATELVELALGLICGAIAVAVAFNYKVDGRQAAGLWFWKILKEKRLKAIEIPTEGVSETPTNQNCLEGRGGAKLQDRKKPSRDIENPNRPSRGPEKPKTPPKGPENPDAPGPKPRNPDKPEKGPENPDKRPPGPADPNDPGGLKT